jgi:hypothetical protein
VAEVDISDPASIWVNYDPERVRAAFRETKGLFKEIDTTQLLEDIYAAREQDSRDIPGLALYRPARSG